MKKKIKVTGPDGKITEEEKILPNKDHFAAQLKYRAIVFRPKKGRGSFKRKKKIDPEE